MVNDSLGHDFGDLLLINVAERLNQCVREVDTIARVGGDEFIIVLMNVESRKHVTLIAQKIINALSKSFSLKDKKASIGASIGIALYPDHEKTPKMLIKRADEMMYVVKRKGKNNFAFYDEVLSVKTKAVPIKKKIMAPIT